MKILSELLTAFESNNPNFRQTEIYNESWLVKLILWQASAISDSVFPLGFLRGSTWFSEALLPTVFRARYRGDRLAETRTSADGVIGHFLVGAKGKADFTLRDSAKQFTVVEAKMGAPLSKGISNAPYFDQAARTVACMAEAAAQTEIKPRLFSRLDFIVLAPEASISEGKFKTQMERESIQAKVSQRVSEFGGEHNDWYQDHFEPLLDRIDLISLSWEEAIQWVGKERAYEGDALMEFYRRCLEFN